jgi:hypothetical protein
MAAAGCGSISPYKGSRGNDDDVLRAEGIAARVDAVKEEACSQAAPADVVRDLARAQRGLFDPAAAEVNLEDFAMDAPRKLTHRWMHSFDPTGRISDQNADDKTTVGVSGKDLRAERPLISFIA